VAIAEPSHGSRMTHRQCLDAAHTKTPLSVKVAVSRFELPADGMWCLQVQAKEVACVGDNVLALDLQLTADLCALPRFHLKAVLRAGSLENPSVVRKSPSVTIFIDSIQSET